MFDETNVAAQIYDITKYDKKNSDTSSRNNWRNLLQLGTKLGHTERRKFLWAWPTEQSLSQLQIYLQQFHIKQLLSIGCGSGLLEWLLRESIGIAIYGLEIDRSWWQSNYAVKSFIELNYIDDIQQAAQPKNMSLYLQQCAHAVDWGFALLFCYFNNRDAFLDYLQHYKGAWLIIIGPRPDIGIHTDPNPLAPAFPNDTNWRLQAHFCFCDTDVVAFYKNKRQAPKE